MTILYLTEHSPLAAGCGGATRSRCLWQALCAVGSVRTLVFDGRHPARSERDAECGVTHLVLPDFYRGPSRRNPTWLKALLRGDFDDAAFASRDEILRELGLAGESFDAVVVRYYWVLARTAAWKVAPCFLDFDDLPSDYHASTDWRDLHGLALLKARALVALRQRVLCRRCRAVWLSNAAQCGRLTCQGRPAVALPNIAQGPGAGYSVPEADGGYLLSVGAMGYRPNAEGLLWFLENVWTKVRARHPNLAFKLVGKDFDESLRARCAAFDGVEVVGFVADLTTAYAPCLGLVAPLFSGGGTCIKVIESQMYGAKVFATERALRGFTAGEIAASRSEVFSGADDFLSALDRWLAPGPAARCAVRESIRAFALRRNSPEAFNRIVAETIHTEVS